VTFTKKGIVIDLGTGGDPDRTGIYHPCVIFRNGYWWCYYSATGGTAEKFCLAVSPDGLTWTKKGAVISASGGSEPDALYVYYPDVHFRTGFWWLYYSGQISTKVTECLAVSPDGLTFTKKGTVLPLGSGSDPDKTGIYGGHILYDNGLWRFYYSGYFAPTLRVCLAMSTDGLTWTKKGTVIDLGSGGDPDTSHAAFPHVIKTVDGFRCYYGGYDGSNWRICLAVSTDGLTWTKKGVVIDLGGVGDPDVSHLYYPYIVRRGGLWWCYYGGYDGSTWRICLAVSPDGF
jgi:predicted GH43/DUF377 family glycosyl hydrolase